MKKILFKLFALTFVIVSSMGCVQAKTVNYKAIYTDLLQGLINNSIDLYGIGLSDLDLDGIPELIIYDGGASSAHGVNIFQIINGEAELRYGMHYRDMNYFSKTYFENLDIPITANYGDSDDLALYVKNNIPIYILRSHNNDGNEEYIQYYTFKNIDGKITAKNIAEQNIISEESGRILSISYKLNGNECEQFEFDSFFNEYIKSDFKIYYKTSENVSISKIEDFINGYIPELKAFDSAYVYINGRQIEFDSLPMIKDGTTLVPIRAICEAMGAEVEWDAKSQTATIAKGSDILKIQIGSNIMYKNNDVIKLDVPAEISYDRTIVPVRAISEGLGAEIQWDGSNNIIDIIY